MAIRIELKYPAEVEHAAGEPTGFEPPFDNLAFPDVQFEPYLDEEVLKSGIVGGEVSAQRSDGDLFLLITFWAPNEPDESTMEQLLESTRVQILDGLGESGFPCTVGGEKYTVLITDVEEPVISMEVDSEKQLDEPAYIAAAAKDNNEAALIQALNAGVRAINAPFQGLTALHYAVFNGNVPMVELLLTKGADPNIQDVNTWTPLLLAAASGLVPDETAAEIAKRLLKAGADRMIPDFSDRNPLDYAQIKKKTNLAKVLSQA